MKIDAENSLIQKLEFPKRNTTEGLGINCHNSKIEKNYVPTNFEESCCWLYHLQAIYGVPSKFIDEILQIQNQHHLENLKGKKTSSIRYQVFFLKTNKQTNKQTDNQLNKKKNNNNKVEKLTSYKHYNIKLNSGNQIQYLPLTYSWQQKMTKDQNEEDTAKIVLYWDPFKNFRTKGESTGYFFFLCLIIITMNDFLKIYCRRSILFTNRR